MTFEDFQKVFESGRRDSYPCKPEDVSYPLEEQPHLTPQEAVERTRAIMSKQLTVMENASTKVTYTTAFVFRH